MVTRITPALAAAYCVNNHSTLLDDHIPTLSPFLKPEDIRALANVLTSFAISSLLILIF